MKEVSTVSGSSESFPVIDITHKPKRLQGDMIRLKEAQEGKSDKTLPEQGEDNSLKVVTLERAITYYKKMSADKENGKLYEATAKWLEELLVTRTVKIGAIAKEVIEGDKENANKDT